MATKKAGLRAVVVRCYSGVFFGYLEGRTGDEVVLVRARHIHYWDSTGLSRKAVTVEDIATIGVGSKSRLSGACERAILLDCKAIVFATQEAVRVIEAVPCQ